MSRKHCGEVLATDSRLAVMRQQQIIFPQMLLMLLTDVVMMAERGISQSMNFFFELLREVVRRL